jgi:type III restriction enzyme
MSDLFYKHPILNSPYEYPRSHWELDEDGQPTQKIIESRRRAEFISPIPKPKKRKDGPKQGNLDLTDDKNLSTAEQRYDSAFINDLRRQVDEWRDLPNQADWHVTPETARLLEHWRHHQFSGKRPFFCQIEAVETLIWLTEVAPTAGKTGIAFLEHFAAASEAANPGLSRLALKLATGTGKTTVMAMIIAWQTINAVHHPQSRRFTKGFLVISPGITIRDRLQVLRPNDPNSYYASRELVPTELLGELAKAKIVITNYHAFMLRERIELSKGARSLLRGRGPDLETTETEGQMLQRVMPELMGLKDILVINDEAHHCYREKPKDSSDEEETISADEKEEAKENAEAARVWISGIEAVQRKLGVARIIDLSATPFFLKGSGYAEGTLFPWAISDFSLMDAIECGIVKLPRVPVSDNIASGDMPKYRKLWELVGPKMPRKGRGKSGDLDPLSIPVELQTALDALYGHYEKTFNLWAEAGLDSPPCFIIICNNTASSKLVFDYVSGFKRTNTNGCERFENGRFPLFRNFAEDGSPLPRPRTLLIDSRELESGDKLDDAFLSAASEQIALFRRETVERTGDRKKADEITDQDILREVMNTVGKAGHLGESIRCVVSVSMLTEGWDANTVTHVLGVRAFGTQLLCEQVIGRALRRQSYDLNDEGLFDVEYADILGIPFDFTAKPIVAPPKKPEKLIHVHAVRPERDELEIRFPRVMGYRVDLPEERLTAKFTADSTLVLTPELVGPTELNNSGIIGQAVDLSLERLESTRRTTILYHLTKRLIETRFRDPSEEPKLYLFGQLKRITSEWLDNHLECKGGTYPAQLLYQELADMACERITQAVTSAFQSDRPIMAILDPYNPEGSTAHVNFTTTKKNRWETNAKKSHVNWAILDSDWEGEFCRVAEAHPQVLAYVKNQGLGFEVPYRFGSTTRRYLPDFIILVDDGHGKDDPLHLVVEIKGYRGEDAKEKKLTMDSFWIPGVNHAGSFGRWAFAEFTEVFEIEKAFNEMLLSMASGGINLDV